MKPPPLYGSPPPSPGGAGAQHPNISGYFEVSFFHFSFGIYEMTDDIDGIDVSGLEIALRASMRVSAPLAVELIESVVGDACARLQAAHDAGEPLDVPAEIARLRKAEKRATARIWKRAGL